MNAPTSPKPDDAQQAAAALKQHARDQAAERLFSEICDLALALGAVLDQSHEEGANQGRLLSASSRLANQLGYLADRGRTMLCGHCMVGTANDWLSSPELNEAEALALSTKGGAL